MNPNDFPYLNIAIGEDMLDEKPDLMGEQVMILAEIADNLNNVSYWSQDVINEIARLLRENGWVVDDTPTRDLERLWKLNDVAPTGPKNNPFPS